MNPYTNRVMINNKRFFFNRFSEIEKIFSRIGGERPQSVSVVGKRKIGKSSLLFHVFTEEIAQEYIKNLDDYIFIFVDLQEKRSMDVEQFFELLQREIKEQMPAELTEGFPESESTYEGFRQTLQKIKSMEKKLIIFMDEFDVVVSNENFGADFFAFLRHVANWFDLAYVVSSREELFHLCQTQEIMDSPFWNIFNTLWLGLFGRESSLDLIRTLSREEGHPLDDYTDFILKLAGDHPFYLQVACCIVFDFLMHHESVSEEDLMKVEEEFKSESQNYFEYLWKKLIDKEKNALCNLKMEENTEEINLLQNLNKKGILMKENDKYTFFSEKFAEFVKEKTESKEGKRTSKPTPFSELPISKISQVLSSETRCEILKHLSKKEADANELEDIFKISKTAIKNHLRILLDVDLIRERVVLRPRIKKVYSINEEGKQVLEEFDELEDGRNEESDGLQLEVGPSLNKDEGKHIARISASVKEKLEIKSGDYVILEAESGESVQCEAKTLRGEEDKVLIDNDTMLLLDVHDGSNVMVRKA